MSHLIRRIGEILSQITKMVEQSLRQTVCYITPSLPLFNCRSEYSQTVFSWTECFAWSCKILSCVKVDLWYLDKNSTIGDVLWVQDDSHFWVAGNGAVNYDAMYFAKESSQKPPFVLLSLYMYIFMWVYYVKHPYSFFLSWTMKIFIFFNVVSHHDYFILIYSM